jgi:hypothetical protein
MQNKTLQEKTHVRDVHMEIKVLIMKFSCYPILLWGKGGRRVS